MPCRAELLWVSACGQANGITLWRNVTSARLTSNNSNNSNNPVDCQRHQVPYSFQSCVTGGASFSMYGLFLRYSVPDSVRCCCMDSFFVFQWQKNAKESKQCIGPCHMAPEGQEILQTCCFTAQVKLDSEISEVPSRSRCNQPIRPSFGTSNPSSTLGAQWDLGGTPCQVQRTWRCSKR